MPQLFKLPDSLIDSYKQYKEDTGTIATWLATVAVKCGYPSDLLNNDEKPKQSQPRLKGKARKLAKTEATPKKSENILQVKEFILLAQHIVKATKPRIQVTLDFASILDRAIQARKDVAQFHRALSVGENEASNESHAHFIGVLEEVRSLLKSRMQSPAGRIALDESTGTFVNSFAALTVEETVESKIGERTTTKKTEIPSDAPRYNVEQDEMEEFSVALWSLFGDFYKFRVAIKTAWMNYALGNDGLIAASMLTNTAIDFARGLANDFAERFPKFAEPEKISQVYFMAHPASIGHDPKTRERPGDRMNFAMYEQADRALLIPYMFLISGADAFDHNRFPIYKPGHFGTLDLSSDRTKKSSREKFQEDMISFLESLPDFFACGRFSDEGFRGQDEILRSFRPYIRNKKISLHLMFALQVWLDIRNTLRGSCARPLQELQHHAGTIEKNLTTNMDFHRNIPNPSWPASNDKVLEQILHVVDDWVLDDPWFTTKKKYMAQLGNPYPLTQSDKFNFYKQHPLFCGLLCYTLKMFYNDACIAFVESWGAVKMTKEKGEGIYWPDLEWMISRHGTNHIFAGERPTTIEDYNKRLLLMLGASATNFASNKRQAKKGRSGNGGSIPLSAAGPRGWEPIVPVSSVFKDRFCNPSTARFDFTKEDVQKIVDRTEGITRELVVPAEDAPEDASDADPRMFADMNIPEEMNAGKWKTITEKYKKCPPDLLLDELLDRIDAEDEMVTFDYLRVHRICWSFLRRLQAALHDDMIKYFGPGYLTQEHHLPFMVGYIFLVASQSKTLAAALPMAVPKDQVSSKLLMEAAAQMEDSLKVQPYGDNGTEASAGEFALMGLINQTGEKVFLNGKEFVPRGVGH